ncbi:unnamed protein product (macronuclear) [Paramecium tetraurelia]|uniref:Uncharacterized protein n=1 Tax=Paramecium tetraurelia TaxID=5888 RepID=A0BKB3_PARTE|nr:uncharacterized protein GSPATT00029611001 [Paramecium tetraurelia]CAK58980.1 unnamed protein product [Paramecium tetraurelia]|eukprot:XP_001426378.1 hypothetical protein (macronuclear) [Paramecium tetraurelia strain d4-2]
MSLYCSDPFDCSDNSQHDEKIQSNQMALYQNHGTSQQVKIKSSDNKFKVSIKDKEQVVYRQNESDYDSQRIQNTYKVSQTNYQNPYNGQNQVVTKYKVTQKSQFN